MPARRQKTIRIISLVLPWVLVILIMSPRLISPQFGLLDDGAMLAEVRQILSGDLSMGHDLQAGRFRPLYWGYFTLVYAVAGPSPFWFFFSQTCLLLILVIEIQVLMNKMGTKSWQGLVASLVFVLSVPIIENFYTLSKGEPLQLIFLLLALIGFEGLKSDEAGKSQVWRGTAIFFSILAAMLVKETTLALLPIAGVWAVLAAFPQKNVSKGQKQAALIFLGAVLLGILAAFGLRALWGTPTLAGGTYTERYDFSLMSLLNRLARWATLYAFYYHFLIPLAILTLILVLRADLKHWPFKNQFFNWLIWVAGWVTALIPWEFTEGYYLLPFSLGIAILSGLMTPHWAAFFKPNSKAGWFQKTLLGLSLALFLLTLPNYITHARTQLTIDRVNQAMVRSVQNITPQNGAVLIGMENPTEYVVNIERFLLDRYERTDIQYDYVSLETLGVLHHYSKGILVLPYVRNLPDLILRTGVEEKFTIDWREVIIYEMEDRLKELDREREGFQMFNINLPVVLCPLIGERGFCKSPDPLIDTREFRFGWEVFQIR